jgi:hypothetical protein
MEESLEIEYYRSQAGVDMRRMRVGVVFEVEVGEVGEGSRNVESRRASGERHYGTTAG